MASELRVNTSSNRVGLGTITYTDSGPIVSGIATVGSGVRVDADGSTSSNYISVGAGNDLKIYSDGDDGWSQSFPPIA